MDMAIVVILFVLGSMIFDKKNKKSTHDDQDSYDTYENAENSGPFQKPSGRPMTWEDMEREYGIKIEHESEQTTQKPNYEVTENYEVTANTQKRAEQERLERIEREREAQERLAQQRLKQQREEQALRKAEEARQADILQEQARLQKAMKKQRSSNVASTPVVAALKPLSLQSNLDTSQLRQVMAWSMILEKPKALQHHRMR